jgi:hypothetical protein
MKIKPKCRSCGRIYLGGQAGACQVCLLVKARKKKVKPLRCLCGKLAIVVLLATVLSPEEAPLELEIPLCRDCRDLEHTMGKETASTGAICIPSSAQIVVVKSLPRLKPPLKGRMI